MLDVEERFQQLAAVRDELRLYALVDGHQYEAHKGERIVPRPGVNRALFHGTDDAPLAHAGPWLYDIGKCPDLVAELADLEYNVPSVSWLITALDLEGLSQWLQLKLDAGLPNGKAALVRFYDPRVLGNLFSIMDVEQQASFFHLIDEWHFIYNGDRVWTGRPDA